MDNSITFELLREIFNNIIEYAHKTDFVIQEAKNGLRVIDEKDDKTSD